jgi:hypothetical protein
VEIKLLHLLQALAISHSLNINIQKSYKMSLRSLNNPIASFIDYLSKTGTDASSPVPPTGLVATGGVISDYTDGSTVYRAHIFTSSGTFSVSALGTFGSNVDVLTVAGGGGGSGGFLGWGPGKGGGAGGVAVATSYPISTSPGSYPISIGAGGVGGATGPVSAPYPHLQGSNGGDTTFTNPSPQVITAKGGGGGGGGSTTPQPYTVGSPGGSGGGGGWRQSGSAPEVTGGTATQPSQNPGIPNLTNYGFAGGSGDTSTAGGGGSGGGAGGLGNNFVPPALTPNPGGPGLANVYAYGPTNPITYAAGGQTGGPSTGPTIDATYSTGNGGMGWITNPSPSRGANGGSGIVIVRYQIAQLTATAKATGGAISYYGGKTIHTFTSTGTFNVTTGPITNIELIVVAGGGGGGNFYGSGGGGAGGYRSITGLTATPGPNPISVGAGGASSGGPFTPGYTGTNSSALGYTSNGGGYGAGYWNPGNSAPAPAGGPGGSGGGGAGTDNGDRTPGGTGNQPSPTTPSQGNPGAAGYGQPAGGGGGGAGGAGSNSTGGLGVQLPSTFQNPQSISGPPYGGIGFPGPGGTYFWVAGGGGATQNGGGGGGPNPSPYAGAGKGGAYGGSAGDSAQMNSGSGGGAYGNANGFGGSGIVLIAYPS